MSKANHNHLGLTKNIVVSSDFMEISWVVGSKNNFFTEKTLHDFMISQINLPSNSLHLS